MAVRARLTGGLDRDSWRLTAVVPAVMADGTVSIFEGLGGGVTAFESDGAVSWSVDAHLPSPPQTGPVEAALSILAGLHGLPAPGISLERVPATDWIEATKRSFPPIRIGRFEIRGSHVETPVRASVLPLLLDAGTAFGTGEHPTTAGCLMAIEQVMGRDPQGPILDMGCGSGILAMAIARHSRRRVLAVDIALESVIQARENAARNGLGHLVRAEPSDGYYSAAVRRGGPYGLIVANILARPLIEMAGDLHRALRPGGWAILSGFLNHQAPAVIGAQRRQGLVPVRALRVGAWTTAVLRRRPGRPSDGPAEV